MRTLALALSTLVSLPLLLAASPARAGEPSSDASAADEVEGDPSAQQELAQPPPKAKSKSKSKTKSKSKSKSKSRNDEACDHRSPIYWHVVEPGEHLGLIAGKYGVLSKDIVALNPALAKNPDHIRVGQKLAICPEIPPREVDVLEHVVASGETFNAIAIAHGLSPEELLAQQEGALADPNKLRVGTTLRIVSVGEIVPGFEPEPPQKGKLVHARKLPQNDAYYIKRPHNAYGTPHTVKMIGQVVARYEKRAKGGPLLRMGDISRKGGGPLQGHRSHQEGKDFDIGLVLKGKLADRMHFSGATKHNVDLRRTWILIEEFIATGEVRVIYLDYEVQKWLYEWAKDNGVSEKKLDEYFQYPRGIGRRHGIIRHWKGHKNHLHVRFKI